MWTRDEIAKLYLEHGYGVRRRCRRLLGSEAEANDMVQEVFVRALENPQAFRGRSAVSTYLYGVATHLCLNRIRNRPARDVAWQTAVGACVDSNAPADPDDRLQAQQLVALLLHEVDEATATIALYHWVDGLTQGEIAELVGLSRVTVNKRLMELRQVAKRLEPTR